MSERAVELAEKVIRLVIDKCNNSQNQLACFERYRASNVRHALEVLCGKKKSTDVYKPGVVLSVLLQFCGEFNESEWAVFWDAYKFYYKSIVISARQNLMKNHPVMVEYRKRRVRKYNPRRRRSYGDRSVF